MRELLATSRELEVRGKLHRRGFYLGRKAPEVDVEYLWKSRQLTETVLQLKSGYL